MARILLSGVLADIRGKVGGSVFQSGQGGLIVRNIDIKPDRNTISQSVRRNITASLLHSWQNLSEAQRLQWNIYKQYNPIHQQNSTSRFINGQQTYIKLNFYLLLYGKTPLTVPSFTQDVTPQLIMSFENDGGVFSMLTTASLFYIFNYIILFMSAPVNASLNNAGSRLRNIIFTPTDGNTSIITNQYIAVFGRVPAVGEQVFVKYSLASSVNGVFLPFVHDKLTILAP